MFKPGHKKVGGRKKGTLNGINVDIQKALAEAFEKAGGVDYLVKVAHDQPAVFCAMLAKMMPKILDVQVNPIQELLAGFKTRSIGPNQQEITVDVADVAVIEEEQYIPKKCPLPKNQQLIVAESVITDVYINDDHQTNQRDQSK